MNAENVRLQQESELYSRLDKSLRHRVHSVLKRVLLNEISRVPSARILDVGCADGMVGKLTGKPELVTGIELNPILAAKARRSYERLLEIDLDAPPIPLGDETFDIVVAADVIEHCKNDRAVMGELRRLLRKNGLLVISLPNIAQFIFRFKLLFGKFDYEKSGVLFEGHLHFYTLKSMKGLVEESGFTIKKIFGTGTLYSYFPIWKSFISPQILILGTKR